MMNAFWLWAQSTGAETIVAGKPTFRFERMQAFAEQPWQLLALVVGGILLAAYAIWMYRRDSVELKPGVGVLLAMLRLGALGAALFYFLDLQKRSELEVVRNSRVLLLVDTSQSMAENDAPPGEASGSVISRIDQVVDELARGSLIADLRKTHDVVVMRFDRETARVVSFEKVLPKQDDSGSEVPAKETTPTGPNTASAGDFDWKEALLPQGSETRLGSALRRLILEEQSLPVSAIVVATDGGQNAGVEPASVIELAKEANIPLYAIGLGSDERPMNIRVHDLVAPTRAFPGDGFTITGYVQASNYPQSSVNVELFSRDSSDREGPGKREGVQRVSLGTDGEIVPVKFELKSEKAGRRSYQLRLVDVKNDQNTADNQQDADVEIVDRKTRVLLLASGATREYRFLAAQLRRDKDMIVDVLLQGASEGISQDANQVLHEFPSTKEALYQYDAIVAFDPDWKNLYSETASPQALIDLLETWVAEEAGGLLVIAGPIHTGEWSRLDELAKLRNLYPVSFQRRVATLIDAQYGSTAPLSVKFTQEGTEAEFLWVEDSASQSLGAWSEFEGVFGYFDVKGPKPGATVYARLVESPSSTEEGKLYLAGQIYGAGRVFYLGSGEMWRLRSIDEAYFERFYTKLLRHVSQGRLLRGSSRGVLLVERDRYRPGDTVVVRAQLADAQHEPLAAPSVALQVTQPDTTTKAVVLSLDPNRKGMYSGQFTAVQEGSSRLDLPVPNSVDEQLTRRILVKGSNLERENPQRNNQLLSEIAAGSGGIYYRGMKSIHGQEGLPALVSQLRDRSETTTLAGSPDEAFERRQMHWLLGIICGCLGLEWLVRRLSKLA